MHWKPLLALIIIIGITGFLLFSEKGVEFTQATIVNRTLVFKITTFQEDFKNIHLEIKEKPFIGVLKYDSVSVGGQNIRVRDNDEVNFYIENMKDVGWNTHRNGIRPMPSLHL